MPGAAVNPLLGGHSAVLTSVWGNLKVRLEGTTWGGDRGKLAAERDLR